MIDPDGNFADQSKSYAEQIIKRLDLSWRWPDSEFLYIANTIQNAMYAVREKYKTERTQPSAAPMPDEIIEIDENGKIVKGQNLADQLRGRPLSDSKTTPDDALRTAIQAAFVEIIQHGKLFQCCEDDFVRHIQPVLTEAVRDAEVRVKRLWARDIRAVNELKRSEIAQAMQTTNELSLEIEEKHIAQMEQRHQAELVAVREQIAKMAEEDGDFVLAGKICSLNPTGALEAIENRARLEEARRWRWNVHMDPESYFAAEGDKRIADLEAKLAPKEPNDEVRRLRR